MGKDQIILSADTSSVRLSIALLKSSTLIDGFDGTAFNRHSSDLIPEIDKLLAKNSYTIRDVDVFCVGLGQGSFTGLRVGVTTMRGLALTLKRPIVGVASIDTLAHNISGHKEQICPIIDAKQNKVYARIYACDGKKITPKTKILLLGIKDLVVKIKAHTVFLGDGIKLYKEYILKEKPKGADFAPESTWYPKAAILGKLGFDKIKKRRFDNLFSLAPIYIYPKECQISR
jgi:tRNA threonylcarbamoyladenosine biosynthesis protein TsaB